MNKLKVWYKRGRLNPSKTLYIDGYIAIFYIFYIVNTLYTLKSAIGS